MKHRRLAINAVLLAAAMLGQFAVATATRHRAPKQTKFTVRVENKNHPITAGVEDFTIFDEQHTVKYYLDREHLLLRSIARDNLESEAGWWRKAGKGRFAYLAPGHTPEALGHPMMQRLIRNAMNWVLRQ